jgi:hypothetical protein
MTRKERTKKTFEAKLSKLRGFVQMELDCTSADLTEELYREFDRLLKATLNSYGRHVQA